MRNKLPEKWFIKCNTDNYNVLNDWFHLNCNDYKGYRKSWIVNPDKNIVYFYPQNNSHAAWGTWKEEIPDYCEITFEQFEQYILKETPQSTNINKLLIILNYINNYEK